MIGRSEKSASFGAFIFVFVWVWVWGWGWVLVLVLPKSFGRNDAGDQRSEKQQQKNQIAATPRSASF